MDTTRIARMFADEMVEHRNRLAGKAEDAQRAHDALTATQKVLAERRDRHRTGAAAATGRWTGRTADGFDKRAQRVTRIMGITGTAAADGAKIVAGTAATLDGGHKAVVRLLDEYTAKAARTLDVGLAVTGAGQRAAVLKAVGEVADMVRAYTAESAKQFRSVRGEMTEAAKRLKALERRVEHDGVTDPGQRRKPLGAAKNKPAKDPRPAGGGSTKASGKADSKAREITRLARTQLGYREGAGNANKYGPSAAWCSSFATWVWRRSGVEIPLLPFTGDVYKWGQANGNSYGRGELKQARPGDVLLFGSGPRSTATSTHIGIVEKVDGDRVTLIEGNSGDQVARRMHTLSSATFYGGVHPR
ncbi:C40 family peptidase [Actinokineospora pegani]|uniref:C40 family peptidase n=1 Tax=Actinokineospora pegani TaxID=2654637 RepID=UPI0012EAB142|nr:CHAP domain-containing protein [Actinokineospora pegani]